MYIFQVDKYTIYWKLTVKILVCILYPSNWDVYREKGYECYDKIF